MGYEHGLSFDAGYVSTANFWCAATAGVVGPDNSYVHPHVCTATRICFAVPLEARSTWINDRRRVLGAAGAVSDCMSTQ